MGTASLLAAAGTLAAYAAATSMLASVPRHSTSEELRVALPRFVQVIMTGGDRFLAANIANWRSLVASTEKMDSDNYAVQAVLQRDAAWLNPFHEDNYYVAAAILPWQGQLAAAQDVLKRAGDARRFDWAPYFYYGFNIYHFEKDPATAAIWLRKAATHAQLQDDAYILESIAASWYERGFQPAVAARVIGTMAEGARSGGFRKHLEARAARLGMLDKLQDAARRYLAQNGKPVGKLADLVDAGLIGAIPTDPFNVGFALDRDGKPVFRDQAGLAK